MYTICAVLYGDYPELAERFLSSLWWPPGVVTAVHLGMNTVGPQTHDLVTSFFRCCPAICRMYAPQENVGKYPLMRRMFQDISLDQPVIWFDDDSWLTSPKDVWEELRSHRIEGANVLGSPHRICQRGRQYEVIRRQPWYTGLPVDTHHRFVFATGAWWVADPRFLRAHDYPFPSLHHNGGDSILGELVRQQGGRIHRFSRAVCHCESCQGRQRESVKGGVVHINGGGRAGRRGLGVTDEQYVWANGQMDLRHQGFQCTIW